MPLAARVVAEIANTTFAVDNGRLTVISKLKEDTLFLVAGAVRLANRVNAEVVVPATNLVQVIRITTTSYDLYVLSKVSKTSRFLFSVVECHGNVTWQNVKDYGYPFRTLYGMFP